MSTALPSRIGQAFFSPAKLFDELAEDPRSFGVLAAGALVVVLATLLVPTEAWVSMVREQTLAAGGDPEAAEQMGGFIRIFGGVGALVFWFVYALVLAGVSTFVFTFILGDSGVFKQYLSVVAHAMLIVALGVSRVDPKRSWASANAILLTLLVGISMLVAIFNPGG